MCNYSSSLFMNAPCVLHSILMYYLYAFTMVIGISFVNVPTYDIMHLILLPSILIITNVPMQIIFTHVYSVHRTKRDIHNVNTNAMLVYCCNCSSRRDTVTTHVPLSCYLCTPPLIPANCMNDMQSGVLFFVLHIVWHDYMP